MYFDITASKAKSQTAQLSVLKKMNCFLMVTVTKNHSVMVSIWPVKGIKVSPVLEDHTYQHSPAKGRVWVYSCNFPLTMERLGPCEAAQYWFAKVVLDL